MAEGRQRRRRVGWLLVGAVAVAVAVWAGVTRPWEARPAPVVVEIVTPGPVTQVLAVNGRIAARSSVRVRAAVSSQAQSVLAGEGADFRNTGQ